MLLSEKVMLLTETFFSSSSSQITNSTTTCESTSEPFNSDERWTLPARKLLPYPSRCGDELTPTNDISWTTGTSTGSCSKRLDGGHRLRLELDYLPWSTTTRVPVDLTTQADNNWDKLQRRTRVTWTATMNAVRQLYYQVNQKNISIKLRDKVYIWSLNNRVKFRTKIPMHCCNINISRKGDFFWFTWYIIVFPGHLRCTACTFTSTYIVHSSVVVRGTCYYFVDYRALVVDMHGIYCHVIVFRKISTDMHGMYSLISPFCIVHSSWSTINFKKTDHQFNTAV